MHKGRTVGIRGEGGEGERQVDLSNATEEIPSWTRSDRHEGRDERKEGISEAEDDRAPLEGGFGLSPEKTEEALSVPDSGAYERRAAGCHWPEGGPIRGGNEHTAGQQNGSNYSRQVR